MARNADETSQYVNIHTYHSHLVQASIASRLSQKLSFFFPGHSCFFSDIRWDHQVYKESVFSPEIRMATLVV